MVNDADGDYPSCVRALVAAGARFTGEEHRPRRADVRAELERGAWTTDQRAVVEAPTTTNKENA
jgi:hypothetical protein